MGRHDGPACSVEIPDLAWEFWEEVWSHVTTVPMVANDRILVGTACVNGPSSSEMLVRVETDGSLSIVNGDLTLSNGLAGARMGGCCTTSTRYAP
ncbi:hypothetical protein ACQP2U_24580 [Nocardia sp. CA-084685]|uniref:hypothetical protein n=1 Tax=Nocardia sp. CA-084685 TaxID=3239970 RepID=UPI003D95B7DA